MQNLPIFLNQSLHPLITHRKLPYICTDIQSKLWRPWLLGVQLWLYKYTGSYVGYERICVGLEIYLLVLVGLDDAYEGLIVQCEEQGKTTLNNLWVCDCFCWFALKLVFYFDLLFSFRFNVFFWDRLFKTESISTKTSIEMAEYWIIRTNFRCHQHIFRDVLLKRWLFKFSQFYTLLNVRN